jgi:LPXTG-motif cell wall-anchored protein
VLRNLSAKLRQSTAFFILLALAAVFLVLTLGGNAFADTGTTTPTLPTAKRGYGTNTIWLGIAGFMAMVVGVLVVLLNRPRNTYL